MSRYNRNVSARQRRTGRKKKDDHPVQRSWPLWGIVFFGNAREYVSWLASGTMSAFPSSRHSATFASICSRTSFLISPVSPAKSARKPWDRELMTSISCNVTSDAAFTAHLNSRKLLQRFHVHLRVTDSRYTCIANKKTWCFPSSPSSTAHHH